MLVSFKFSQKLDMSVKVAVVTGSNKGIGFSIVKGLCKRFDGVVYLTSRDDARGKAAVAQLNASGLSPQYHQLDVVDRESVLRFRDHVKKKYGGIDILVNNAAIANSAEFYNSYEENKNIVEINYKSILTIQELIYPLVRKNGRILNISSDCGHLSNIRNKYWIDRLSNKNLTLNDINEFVEWFLKKSKNGDLSQDDIADKATFAAYRVAKVAVSALTMLQQRELEGRNICVNSMHPGLVRTDMTLGAGFYSADEAAETPLYLVLEAPATLKGSYVWYDRKVLDWYDYNADYYFKTATLQK
ncbi:PREDICTED: carbonyl reductase [NADPH] 1-like [Papilio polytes]|uniref:carbonyl reductase [NADPH] 1-like n=1 Tax=Papilio polytes TaxID=76194 RepID=UPI000675DCAC|nr:PREDICTED: carbonyl reductase [NADPH] 1-like [Papilio polytes]